MDTGFPQKTRPSMLQAAWNLPQGTALVRRPIMEEFMGRYMLLWLLGVPLPILALIWAFGGLH